MVATPLTNAGEAVQQDLGNYHPEHIIELRPFFSTELPEFFGTLAGSIGAMADRFREELPLHQQIPEHIQEMAGVLAGLRDKAQELSALFENLHKDDLNRLDEPRPGEQMWDVGANR